jgi:DNA invertase Pin-like site-specific DNA recombinase
MPSPTIETLAELREARDEIDAEITKTIARLRKMQVSWEAIAKQLGVTRQSVHRKYAQL